MPGTAAALLAAGLAVGPGTPDISLTLDGPDATASTSFRAAAGRDYYVGVAPDSPAVASLTDPAGRTVSWASPVTPAGFGLPGLELHAKLTGTYTVSVRPDPTHGSDVFPIKASVWAWKDCRGGPATRCSIAPGWTLDGSLAAWDDGDAFTVSGGQGGRAYVATLRSGVPSADLGLTDGKGSTVAEVPLPPSGPAVLRFVLPGTGGPFFVKVQANGKAGPERDTYTLTLRRE